MESKDRVLGPHRLKPANRSHARDPALFASCRRLFPTDILPMWPFTLYIKLNLLKLTQFRSPSFSWARFPSFATHLAISEDKE